MSYIYTSDAGHIACEGHIGSYAALEAAQGKNTIRTPLDHWTRLDDEGQKELRDQLSIGEDEPLCEGCLFGRPKINLSA